MTLTIRSRSSNLIHSVLCHKNTIYVVRSESMIPAEIQCAEIVSEYDQEIPQSQTADNPVAPRGRAAQPSRDTRKTN